MILESFVDVWRIIISVYARFQKGRTKEYQKYLEVFQLRPDCNPIKA